MVINKDICDQTLLGHIQSVDYRCETCKVYVYVESDNSGVYVREVAHAHAMDTVRWACIINAAHRRWEGNRENGIRTDYFVMVWFGVIWIGVNNILLLDE